MLIDMQLKPTSCPLPRDEGQGDGWLRITIRPLRGRCQMVGSRFSVGFAHGYPSYSPFRESVLGI